MLIAIKIKFIAFGLKSIFSWNTYVKIKALKFYDKIKLFKWKEKMKLK
jgi:hypothetical protein